MRNLDLSIIRKLNFLLKYVEISKNVGCSGCVSLLHKVDYIKKYKIAIQATLKLVLYKLVGSVKNKTLDLATLTLPSYIYVRICIYMGD